ncbi:MAG: cytochrome ubiquinol oxidase subunit I [bacterium]|nr:cytochrome ubiquinol oxidase subunit I [bacterium]
MSDLLAARSQMAMSLAFHIIFSVIGIGLPLLMVIAEILHLKTKNNIYLILTKRWAKGAIILFAVGAVSGTVLSFELGLLWPRFMEFAGPIIGMPFSLEGFAFFLEAIFLAIYVFGFDRVGRIAHLFAGIMVVICGTMSGVFIVTANAWMNTPVGFTLENNIITNINPLEAMLNPAAFSETLHMTLASFVTIGFAVAGVHAFMLLKNGRNQFHQKGFAIAFAVGSIFIPLQWISGDRSAKNVAINQPIKLAAMEGLWETSKDAPLTILGWPDEETQTTNFGIKIPYMLSMLAYGNFNAEVRGLKSFPKENLPPVLPVHISFQVMLGCATYLLLLALTGLVLKARKKTLNNTNWFLWLTVFASPLGFIAVEAGWMVTEIGRQPWVVYNILRTKDAVTPMPNLVVPFSIFTILYFCLSLVVIYLLKRIIFSSPVISDK